MNKLSVKEMFRYFLVNITVEPMIALLIIPSVFSRLANQDLNLQKACSINLKFSDKICQDLKDLNTTGLKNEESQVQKLVAEMTIWTTLLGLIPLVLVMFSGAWSDRKGKRKPFLLLPIVGEFFASVGLILCVYFSSLPMEVSGFVGAFFPAATGGWTVTFMAVFSYIGDITEEHMRTVRIGFVDLFCSGGVPIGTALSGVLLEWFGFYGVFSLAAVFYLSGFIYGLFCVKESCEIICLQNTKTKTTILSPQLSEFKNYEMFDKKSEKKWDFWNFLKEFFNVDHVTDTLKVACKDKSKNRQKKILLLIVVLFVVTGPLYGEMTVMYLFMRYKFNWDEIQFSMFSTYNVIAHLCGTAFSVGVFSHLLKIDDALIGVMSSTSKILAGFVYAFAQTEWQIYLAPLVDIVNGTSFIAMRSIASKLVPPEELGKLNSLYGACEALTPLVYGPMYAFVYAHTLNVLPGAFMLLGGALTFPAVVIFGWMYTQHRKEAVLSRKPSLNGEVLNTLQVDPVAASTIVSDSQVNNTKQGVDNLAYVEEKANEK